MRGTVAKKLRRAAYQIAIESKGMIGGPQTFIGRLIFPEGKDGKFFYRVRVGSRKAYHVIKREYKKLDKVFYL